MSTPSFAVATLQLTRRRIGIAFEFARYFAASAAALGVDFGLFDLLLHAGLSYALAAAIGFSAGAVVAYAASVLWVFDTRAVRSAPIEFGLFVLVGILGLLLTEALLRLGVERFGLAPLAAKVGAAGIVFVFNFAVRKAMLFSVRRR